MLLGLPMILLAVPLFVAACLLLALAAYLRAMFELGRMLAEALGKRRSFS